ncbi:MAG: hypothetical protein GY953_27725, partial [bacterium]|nr:hypothetical protein [bacterium]
MDGLRVTHDVLSVFGLEPVLGRFFLPDEDRPGGEKVAMLGHGIWRREFGGRGSVLGETIRLDSVPHTIVGVLPPEASFPEDAEVWVPLVADPEEQRGWYLGGVGRLKPGVTIPRALDDLTRVHKNLIEKRKVNEITSPVIQPLR